MKKTSVYELLENEIMNSDMSEAEKNKKLSKLLKARGQKINLMLVGATGSGKSSTINSLFNTSVAKWEWELLQKLQTLNVINLRILQFGILRDLVTELKMTSNIHWKSSINSLKQMRMAYLL